jgi:hypothetical protein
MNQIHRRPVELGVKFRAPASITLGYQPSRNEFSIWYIANDPEYWEYMVVATGEPVDAPIVSIRQTVILDGHYAFHLVCLGVDRTGSKDEAG